MDDSDFILKEETHRVIGLCMEVHRNLGHGFLEVVYKDALEYEFRSNGILFEREKQYDVWYKDIKLPHKFFADFVVFDQIILEVKSTKAIASEFLAQGLNYLRASDNKVCLVVNFGRKSLEWKRLVY